MTEPTFTWLCNYIDALERRLEQHEIDAAVAEANGDLERVAQ